MRLHVSFVFAGRRRAPYLTTLAWLRTFAAGCGARLLVSFRPPFSTGFLTRLLQQNYFLNIGMAPTIGADSATLAYCHRCGLGPALREVPLSVFHESYCGVFWHRALVAE